MNLAARITAALAQTFPSFGGGKGSQWNPIAAALKDHPPQFAAGVPIADVVNATLAGVFLTMPVPPDDMGSPEGLAAFAEAVLQWRADCGHPAVYDGPVGSSEPQTEPDRLRVAIVVRGGCVEDVYLSTPRANIEIVDLDTNDDEAAHDAAVARRKELEEETGLGTMFCL